MSNKNPTDSRRKLLKSIAAGSGAVVAGKSLPESWSKPVVDSVMLPAHAETTEADSEGGGIDITNCDDGWVKGDSGGGKERYVGDFKTRCECEERVKELHPLADGASWNPEWNYCYAEWDWETPTDTDSEYVTKKFD